MSKIDANKFLSAFPAGRELKIFAHKIRLGYTFFVSHFWSKNDQKHFLKHVSKNKKKKFFFWNLWKVQETNFSELCEPEKNRKKIWKFFYSEEIENNFSVLQEPRKIEKKNIFENFGKKSRKLISQSSASPKIEK